MIQIILKDPLQGEAHYWLVSGPGEETDLCFTDPRFDVDLSIDADLRAFTSAWMGHSSFETEIAAERITLSGQDLLGRTLTKWLVRSSFADKVTDCQADQNLALL